MHGCPSWSKGPDSSSGSENCVGSNPTPCKIYKIVLNTLIYILQIFNWFKKLFYIFLCKMSHQYVWLSIDPINKKIDYYPKLIAEKIEKAYLDKKKECILGLDFYDATIHFYESRMYKVLYQTTPAIYFGRCGYKAPGYRSVERIDVTNNKNIVIKLIKYKSEWRINTENFSDSTETLEDIVPNSVIINSDVVDTDVVDTDVFLWNPEDLKDETNYNKNIIVWQWCKGTPEKEGNLMLLDNNWWIPFLYKQAYEIDKAYNNDFQKTVIKLPNGEEKFIEFINDSIYGKQKDITNTKVRLIRKKIMTISEFLNYKIKNINDTSILKDSDEIPSDYICAITQLIMTDPVTTCDGFTYEKYAIEKWLETSNISPLTGLNLDNKELKENIELKKAIFNFVNEKK